MECRKMTLDEAIKVLEEERKLLQSEGDPVEFPSALKLAEALGMVIETVKELEARRRANNVPDTNIGNMICRQAAIDAEDDKWI
jgi:hypothetical protein